MFCSVSDWIRGQPPPKLLHSVPQCCSHCPRSRQPTHSLTPSPHFNRKFISSTYGLEGTRIHNRVNLQQQSESPHRKLKNVPNSGGFVCLTLGETSGGTGSGCPWCPCGPEAPGRAGAWSSTLSGGSTPSPSRRSTGGSRSPGAAAAPVPCTAECPSQKTYPGRETAGGSSARAPTEPERQPVRPSMLDTLWTYITPTRTSGLVS